MIKGISPRTARRAAWSLVALYLLLLAPGFVVQLATGVSFADMSLAVTGPIYTGLLLMSVIMALLVSRQPTHPIGWIILIMPTIAALDQFTFGYAYYGLILNPGALPASRLILLWQHWTGMVPSFIPLSLILLLFPNGRFLSSRWRLVVWTVTGAAAVYMGVTVLSPKPFIPTPFELEPVANLQTLATVLEPLRWLSLGLGFSGMLAGSYALLIRLHRSRGVERQQLKWVVYASFFMVPGMIVMIAGSLGSSPSASLVFHAGIVLQGVAIVGIAVAVAAAVFRYRLYDIDIIINRTLVYGSLTAVLALIYFGTVILLQAIVNSLTGGESPLAIVISTLVIAALFSPLRRRIQELIDRRFYRRKYDAAKTLASFAASVRNEVELDRLAAQLLAVVGQTMQPEHLSLWLNSE